MAFFLWSILLFAVFSLPAIAALTVPVGLGLAAFLFRRPAVGLLAILVARVLVDLLWWTPGALFGLNLMEAFSGGVAAIAIALVARDPAAAARHPFFLPFVPFVGVLTLAAVRAGDPRNAAEIAARFLSPALLLFLVSAHLERRHVHALLRLLALAAILPIALGFYHLAHGQMNEMTLSGYARLRGAYANIHNHAHAMALFAAVGAYHLRRISGWKRIFPAVFIAAAITLLGLTYVRTALVGLVVFSLVFLLLERQWKIAAIAFFALTAAVTGSAVLQDRFADIATLLTADPAEADTGKIGSGRISLWTEAFASWASQSPLDLVAGVGLDRQRTLNHHALDAHNDYLSLLFQLGPAGLATFLVFHALVVHTAWSLRRSPDPDTQAFAHFAIALTAMVVVDNFLSNSYINRVHIAWLYWALCGAVFALDRERLLRRRVFVQARPIDVSTGMPVIRGIVSQ
jgi:hypothetical protein